MCSFFVDIGYKNIGRHIKCAPRHQFMQYVRLFAHDYHTAVLVVLCKWLYLVAK